MTLLDLHSPITPARRGLAAIMALIAGLLVGLLLVTAAQKDIPADDGDIWHGNVARSAPD